MSCISVLSVLLQNVYDIAQDLFRFITSRGISFAAGVSIMVKNVTFCFARYNFKTCDFASGVVNVNGVVQQ